jgi:hypothetical protein
MQQTQRNDQVHTTMHDLLTDPSALYHVGSREEPERRHQQMLRNKSNRLTGEAITETGTATAGCTLPSGPRCDFHRPQQS